PQQHVAAIAIVETAERDKTPVGSYLTQEVRGQHAVVAEIVDLVCAIAGVAQDHVRADAGRWVRVQPTEDKIILRKAALEYVCERNRVAAAEVDDGIPAHLRRQREHLREAGDPDEGRDVNLVDGVRPGEEADERIRSAARPKDVGVISGTADEPIIAWPAVEDIVAATAQQHVIATAAFQYVVVSHRISGGVAIEKIRAVGAEDRIIAGATKDHDLIDYRIDRRHCCDGDFRVEVDVGGQAAEIELLIRIFVVVGGKTHVSEIDSD